MMILEQLAMFDTAKVEIKKEHQLLMLSKTTSFKKKGKGKMGNFKKNGKCRGIVTADVLVKGLNRGAIATRKLKRG